jgi:hypothetical protein
MPGQVPHGRQRLLGQVLDLVEKIFQVAGVGVPAVVRIAVAGFGGQLVEDVVELDAQFGGRVGPRADPGEQRGNRVRARVRRRAGAARVQAAGAEQDADLGAVHDRLDLGPHRGNPRYLVRQGHRLGEHILACGSAQ